MTTRRLPAALARRKDTRRLCRARCHGQALAYVYSRASETDAMQAKVLTDDEARRFAANIARLPQLLGHKECRPRGFLPEVSPQFTSSALFDQVINFAQTDCRRRCSLNSCQTDAHLRSKATRRVYMRLHRKLPDNLKARQEEF
jgi:hypothetical protein